ncbi:MAG: choline-sulfatase [Thermoleophilaceae bacterium]|nr:choline-sulfatase [Thermoleophilaceae bacterium]
MAEPGRPPNLLLLITDQQRAPMHWPDEPGWLDALTPTDADLRRTGVSFEQACIATCMCSPSRASFLTGTFPSRHGVKLTLTYGDLWPDPANVPDVLRTARRLLASGDAPRARLLRAFGRSSLRLGPKSGREPELPTAVPTIARMLRARGYEVVLKGKWHLTKPVDGHEFGPADSVRLERDYGFAGWEAPDAGGDAKAHHFGGGNAGRSGEGWDEDYTRQALGWLAQAGLPEPFCLIVSLVNPHDVLGYPNSYEKGGYDPAEFRDLGVQLPPTLRENLRDKPGVQSLAQLGQAAYLGALHDDRARLDYVNFYAHLHRLVDRKLGRIVAALGDGGDPASLRARTMIVRFSDHGELGLSHGGLRQKMFNAYEETMRVPLVVSNPVLFPAGATSAAPASLVDVVPTLLALAGAGAGGAVLDGVDLSPVLARHARPQREALGRLPVAVPALTAPAAPSDAVRDDVLFTYDDHQAGTAFQEAPGQPNRIRCVRDPRHKYAVYIDPTGRAGPEYELYDLEADPNEASNLVDKRTGVGRTPGAEGARRRLHERLAANLAATGTAAPPLPA